ncbi:SGNH/GDSL hydrolase family protein [Mycetohabitans sp. B2]|uniref:SGNH/GDSL hydrolase family protein n=1 Tax=Mycetohabitans sp. B2 TaxID=2841274 RepID=UPI001F208522|nr:SGNH/GDSL hydrolase family protein [Mycetohabitans sp. B2]MCF7696494.1 SGNH/GDSL hydrolase family protein [Mycetohabitans sp. B2]
MKNQQNTWQRFVRTTVACSTFALLAACGGGTSGDSSTQIPAGNIRLQVVTFGDSLSDAGTYAVTSTSTAGPLALGGGRFTTNPGQVWTQNVAQYYGDTLTPAFKGGFGVPLSAAGGLDYAQGAATVNTSGSTTGVGMTAEPVTWQVSAYLQTHGSFNSNQLVLIEAGANDVLGNAQALAAGQITQAVARQNITTAAIALAHVVGQILQAGATKVVVANLPNIGMTPLGVSSADGGTGLTQLSAGFNTALKAALTQGGIDQKVIQLDVFSWITNLAAHYQANGFKVGATGTACNLTKMVTSAQQAGVPNPASYGTSLLCAPDSYTEQNADQTYMFADQIHPTTRTHQLFAQFVQQQIAAHGIGK